MLESHDNKATGLNNKKKKEKQLPVPFQLFQQTVWWIPQLELL
jgi:hypothetical protein